MRPMAAQEEFLEVIDEDEFIPTRGMKTLELMDGEFSYG
jgi:hypothetical protein